MVLNEEGSDSKDIELQQFRTIVATHEQNPNKWVEVFHKFDKNGDGRISFKELKARLREYHHDIPADTVRRILRKADLDENGTLDLNEFLSIIRDNKEIRGLFSQSVDKWVQTVCFIPKKPALARAKDVPDAETEYEEHYTCCPPPLFMIGITILEMIAYIYDAAVQKPGQLSVEAELAILFIYNPHRRAEAWRYLTYMFVHIGVFHLLVNLLVQIMLGIPLEMVHHWWRVALVYFAGVVAGSLATSVSDPSIYLAGASGGVYAVMAAHVATIIMVGAPLAISDFLFHFFMTQGLPTVLRVNNSIAHFEDSSLSSFENWSEMRFAWLQLLIFIILAVTDVGTAVYNRYILDINDQVGYVAHLAGAVAGLLVGINVLRNFEVRPWERRLRWVTVIFYTILMLTAIIWNAAFPSYFPKQLV